jgi:hypothetical protein
VQHRPITHNGVDAMQIVHNGFELVVALSAGPRILGFRKVDGLQLFASLPALTLVVDGGPAFNFYGGHRLWVAPEVPAVTYAADDDPVSIDVDDVAGTAQIVAPADTAGWEKSIMLQVVEDGVIVDHLLRNTSGAVHEAAPWAITQLAVGGVAMIPLGSRDSDEFQPDRSLVVWPYTRWDDPLLSIADRHIEVVATRSDPLKIGTALRRGWLAYRLADQLFVKRAVHPAGAILTDLGASGQCYCNDAFLELETLGALAHLAPGAIVRHREVWEIHSVPADIPLAVIAGELNLDAPSSLLESSPLEEK